VADKISVILDVPQYFWST